MAKLGKKKRCRDCGAKVSQPHAENCANNCRDCKFKKRGGVRGGPKVAKR